MRRLNWTKLLASATAMTLLSAMPAMAAWQYTLQGPIAIWTETTTGQQVCVYAGQPAPDGTPAPTVTMTAETFTTEAAQRANTAQSIAAANAAVDAAKAARGGNVVQETTLTTEQLAANTAAANANLQIGDVTTIAKVLPKRGSGTGPNNTYTNATLPTIQTQDQSQLNQSGVTAGTYLSPAGVAQTTKTYNYNTTTGTYSYYASDGHLVTNAGSPNVGPTAGTTTQTTTSTTTTTTTGTTGSTTTQTSTGMSYTGTLPSTGATNVNTYKTPQA
ncbi:hypothetical protein [Oribacterium sp. P9]|uniref:hypothetical protein n=1 Tax=unclassified Oribacterium TaxID=2629782 RepID=UPI002A7D6CB3|nr:hypothetical protein [Oliverpabstia sp.]